MDDQEPPLERPWQALDPAVREIIAPVIPAIAEEITAAIAASIDEYRQPMRGAFGRGVRVAIDGALRQFLEQVGRPASGVRPGREVYIALGRGEYRAGRRLDALQAAYRLGARVAWRRVSTVARDAGLDATTLSLLAESIFAYIDEVSAESVEGYASEQAASAGERQRARQALVRRLVVEGIDDAEARQAAAAVDWPLPRRLAALAADHRDAERLATLAGEGSIGALIDDLVCVLVVRPRRSRPARAARAGARRAFGGARPERCARRCGRSAGPGGALRAPAQAAGVLPADRLVFADQAARHARRAGRSGARRASSPPGGFRRSRG
jgi:hypothetical protein